MRLMGQMTLCLFFISSNQASIGINFVTTLDVHTTPDRFFAPLSFMMQLFMGDGFDAQSLDRHWNEKRLTDAT